MSFNASLDVDAVPPCESDGVGCIDGIICPNIDIEVTVGAMEILEDINGLPFCGICNDKLF